MPALAIPISLIRSYYFGCAVILLIAIHGCGSERRVIFKSSSGRAEIEVSKPRRLNSRLEVLLSTEKGSRIVYRTPGEAFFSFADAYWSPDEAKVGVVINGTALFTLAFEVSSGKEIPFNNIRQQIAAKIRSDYNVPQSEPDPIQWTFTGGANELFAKGYLNAVNK